MVKYCKYPTTVTLYL